MPPSATPRTGLPPRLIVNADDLGMSAGVNAAIFEGHERGIITSASLMATGAAFEPAIEGLRTRPELGCGVHLVLHDERPVLPAERVPHLVRPDGRMRPLGATLRALFTGRIPRSEIEAEYAAQIERVLAAGVRPTHLDSHCHLHGLARIGAIVHRLGERYAIPCARRPELSGLADFRGCPLSRYPVALLIDAAHRRAHRRNAHRLRMPDRLLGLAKSGDIDAAWIERVAGTLPDGEVCELMVHPGDGSGAGDPYADHGPAKRKRELEAVTAPAVRAALERRGVQLVNYRALAAC